MNFVELFSNISGYWATFFIAMLPVAELRVALPVAIEVYKINPLVSFLISITGNMVPVTIILLVIPKIHSWLLRQKTIGKLFGYFLTRAENKFKGDFAKWGLVGLAIFVGIPLPMTGAWTGALAAFVFNIPFKKSWPTIFAGVIMAGIIVLLITLFAGSSIRWIFGI